MFVYVRGKIFNTYQLIKLLIRPTNRIILHIEGVYTAKGFKKRKKKKNKTTIQTTDRQHKTKRKMEQTLSKDITLTVEGDNAVVKIPVALLGPALEIVNQQQQQQRPHTAPNSLRPLELNINQ
jgi:hypothetical protein